MEGVPFFFEWEIALMVWLQSFQGSVAEHLAVFFTSFGEELALVALIGILYWGIDKKLGEFVGINAVAGLTVGCMLKNVFLRRRPYFDHSEIQCLRAPEKNADFLDVAAQGYSCPSLHAENTMTLFGSVALYLKKWYLPAAFIIFAVGLSRCFLGVHYPTDVLLGWGVGAICLLVFSLLQRRLKSPLKMAVILLTLALPGWFFCKSNDFYSSYGILLGLPVSFWFEEKYVRFENTNRIVPILIRVLGGILIFAVTNSLLKLPFSEEFLETSTLGAHIVRSIRYAIVLFLVLGVYPLAFRFRPFRPKRKC